MEDNLKILKVEYLSNRLLDHTRFLNLDLGDQSKVYIYFKWRLPHMDDDLKILKVEYLSNYCMDCDLWEGGNRGKPRGNLECGSAQPGLLTLFSKTLMTMIYNHLIVFFWGKILTSKRSNRYLEQAGYPLTIPLVNGTWNFEQRNDICEHPESWKIHHCLKY